MTLCIPASALHKENGAAGHDDAGSGHVIRGANHISLLVVLYSVFSSFLQKRSPIDWYWFLYPCLLLGKVSKSIKSLPDNSVRNPECRQATSLVNRPLIFRGGVSLWSPHTQQEVPLSLSTEAGRQLAVGRVEISCVRSFGSHTNMHLDGQSQLTSLYVGQTRLNGEDAKLTWLISFLERSFLPNWWGLPIISDSKD